jgi:hypothetical protein
MFSSRGTVRCEERGQRVKGTATSKRLGNTGDTTPGGRKRYNTECSESLCAPDVGTYAFQKITPLSQHSLPCLTTWLSLIGSRPPGPGGH